MRYLCLFISSMLFVTAQAQIKQITNFSTMTDPSIHWATVFKDKLCFMAYRTGDGVELMTCDKQDQVTTVHNTNSTDSHTGLESYAHRMAIVNGTLCYGNRKDNMGSAELCFWDGTNTPQLLSQLNPSADSRDPIFFTALNGKLYFIREKSSTAVSGKSVCEYDPTNHSVKNICSSIEGSNSNGEFYQLYAYNGKLVIISSNSLDQAGGSSSGNHIHIYDPATQQLSLMPGTTSNQYFSVHSFVEANGSLYFIASTSPYGDEVYKFDGSNAVTNVTDINSGSNNSVRNWEEALGVLNGRVYFVARNTNGGPLHLYSTKDKPQDATLVFTFPPSGTTVGYSFVTLNNKMYFTASDANTGIEMWVYDGTNPPKIFADWAKPPSPDFGPRHTTVFNNTIYFAGLSPANQLELHRLTGLASTNDVALNTQATIYPNPTNGNAHLDVSLNQATSFAIQLTDMNGRIVYRNKQQLYSKGKHNIVLPMQRLTSGTYVYSVVNNKGMLLNSGRIIKQ